MAALEIHHEERAGHLTLRLTGTLDNQTAMLLRHSLDAVSTQEVIVDFAHLREFRDSAVGVVVHDMNGRKVQLRGLAGHHQRMFRYFGWGLNDVAPKRAYYTPEEALA